MACERLALRGRTDPALVDQVVAHLRQGDLVVLPTETVYGLAVLPGNAGAVAAARQLKGRTAEHPFTWHLAASAELRQLSAADDPRLQRLIQRYWPGPLTCVLPDKAGGTVGVRVPAHDFTRAVISACDGPLWLTSVNTTGSPPESDPNVIEQRFGNAISVLVDDGPSPLGSASTVVRLTGPELEVLRHGILSADEVLHTAAATILFVCTGNTCRSPLAAALARDELGRLLHLSAAQLLARGVAFTSAGTATLQGMPASEGSVLAAAELQLDLGDHKSQPFDAGLARRAARIYCLTRSHITQVCELAPESAGKVELLHPEGKDIADPFGGNLAMYRRARDEILAAVRARVPEWRGFVAG
jgi:protein arginine phosphatase